MTIGEKIKMYRKQANLTQTELGNKLGVQKNAVSKWECGRVDEIPLSKLKAMAAIFGISPLSLTDWEYNGAPSEAEIDMMITTSQSVSSGRQAVQDEMRRLFGTEHATLSTYLCEDKTKASVLYYRAVDRRAAPELSGLIGMVEGMDFRELEKIRRLIGAYLNASDPIREIVDTALKPYDEEDAVDAQIG